MIHASFVGFVLLFHDETTTKPISSFFTPKRMAVEPDKDEDFMGWIRMAVKLEKSVR